MHAAQKIRIERVARDHRRIEQLGIDVGRDGGAADHPSIREHDAAGPALLDHDLPDRRAGLDLDAMLRGRGGHRLRDRPHAADGVPPDALLAVHLAECVMQEHVGGAGRIGAGVVPDDGVEAVQGLHEVAFEPAVEIVGRRLGEQIVQRTQIFRGKPRAAGCRVGRL